MIAFNKASFRKSSLESYTKTQRFPGETVQVGGVRFSKIPKTARTWMWARKAAENIFSCFSRRRKYSDPKIFRSSAKSFSGLLLAGALFVEHRQETFHIERTIEKDMEGDFWQMHTWGSFLEGPEKLSHPESQSKSSRSNLIITALFYSYILNMNRGSLHTRSFRRIHLFVFRYRLTKNALAGPKSFRGFRETGPWYVNSGIFLLGRSVHTRPVRYWSNVSKSGAHEDEAFSNRTIWDLPSVNIARKSCFWHQNSPPPVPCYLVRWVWRESMCERSFERVAILVSLVLSVCFWF